MQVFAEKQSVENYIKKVAIYLRKSRGEDEEKELKTHRETIVNACEEKGWEYIEYKEIGSGDSIEARTKIKFLLEDIEEGMFDAVCVFDYDRLGRGNATDQDKIIKSLRLSQTLIVTFSPYQIFNPNDEKDEQYLDFKGFLARQEYKIIVKRLTAGKKFGARLGRWSNGIAPFGYKYDADRKGLVIDDDKSEIYKTQILHPFLDGHSTHDIAWTLNKLGIPSPRNGKWNNNTVRNMLANEVYLGWIVTNKTEGVHKNQNKSGNKKPFRKKSKDEWVTVKGCHPRLKTDEEHDKILSLLRSRSSKNKGNSINPLSGLVKCFNCGSTMIMQRTKQGDIHIRSCTECNQNKGGSSELITAMINEKMMSFKEILINKQVSLKQDKFLHDILIEIDKLEREVDQIEIAIERIEDAFEMGMYTAEKTKKKIKERSEQISIREEKIKELKKKSKNFSSINNEERIKIIDQFLNEMNNNLNGKRINQLYKKVIHSIIWKRILDDEVRVTINFL